MATGKIIQVIGAVVDVEFPQDAVPKVYDALEVENGTEKLVLEVQQQLGGGVVRCIAMGTSDGLRRGLKVNNLDHPIEVPVGKATLGRIMNVLGQPIDMKGDIGEEERWAIHRAAPSYEELSSSQELLETGIKVMDLICPFAKGGKVGLFGGRLSRKVKLNCKIDKSVLAGIVVRAGDMVIDGSVRGRLERLTDVLQS